MTDSRKTLDVIRLGHPVLRKLAVEVDQEEIVSASFQHFLDQLIETMRVENGAGIAAPQVDVSKRVFVMEMENNPRYPDGDPFSLRVAINPELELIGEANQKSWEGCLSIPDLRGCLQRHESVVLKALNRKGEPYTVKLKGFEAIVAQHETDHLNGLLFLDRMENMQTLAYAEEFLKYWK